MRKREERGEGYGGGNEDLNDDEGDEQEEKGTTLVGKRRRSKHGDGIFEEKDERRI